ncbi:MAG: ArsR family transcriptional regulator [Deltaproteobacteria bacterium]|nr:ArsR family transcriptional regulator [Deltaproteobacteria bacterium]
MRLTPQEQTELAALTKALGHPARVAILQHLLETDSCVCGRIVEVLPLAQSTVSQHLKQLRTAGLIRGEIEGPRICYCVDTNGLDRLKTLLHALLEENP